MVAREQLEGNERRAPAGRALVLEPSPQELDLLPVAELADRAVRDRPLPVVRGAGRTLDLVLPLGAQARQRALVAFLGQRGRLGCG
jgi:hypothetical protein